MNLHLNATIAVIQTDHNPNQITQHYFRKGRLPNENVIIHYSSIMKPASFMFPFRFSLSEEIMDSMLIMKAGLYLTSSLWQLDESVFSCSLFQLNTATRAVSTKVCSLTPERSMTLKISVYKFKTSSKLVLFNNPQLHIYTTYLLCSPSQTPLWDTRNIFPASCAQGGSVRGGTMFMEGFGVVWRASAEVCKPLIKVALLSQLEPICFSLSPSQYFDLAADVLAENAHLTYKFLSPVSCTSTHTSLIKTHFRSGFTRR